VARAVVLLRAVNVGGRNRISMPDFRSLLESVGCTDVQTYVQSGNAVVSTRRSPAALEKAVAAGLRTELDLAVDVLVRTADELDAVVAENPFAAEDLAPTALHAVFLSGPAPDLPDVSPDRMFAGDRVLYVAYAAGSQASPAGKVLGSKRISSIATARNWRTVLALQELARVQR
jgi:uncharacterized protein (DUF1697 family)